MLRSCLIRIFYGHLLKPLLFKMDPAQVHDRFALAAAFLGNFRLMRALMSLAFNYNNSRLHQKLMGIEFGNPVGLSAGFDKDADFVNVLPNVGFGFSQVGTVTLHAYEGNPPPRAIRLPEQNALIVNYGLKNEGADKIIAKLKRARIGNFPLSISIGKTNCKGTANLEAGVEDYFACLQKFVQADLGDFYTLNISCPNTFGGEPFTDEKSLGALLKRIAELKIKKAILLKMPINLEWKDFEKLLQVAVEFKLAGVIIGNLNKKDMPAGQPGGLSGKPTEKMCNTLISQTYKKYGDKLLIVGVGGIFSARDAYKKICLGASLVQLITGMIYQGPQLIGEINRGLVRMLEEDGFKSIKEAVGSAHRV